MSANEIWVGPTLFIYTPILFLLSMMMMTKMPGDDADASGDILFKVELTDI